MIVLLGGTGIFAALSDTARSGTNSTENPVHADAVRGRVRWGVPGLGYVVSALTGWRGAVILVGGPLGLLALSEWSSHARHRREQRSAEVAIVKINPALSLDDGG